MNLLGKSVLEEDLVILVNLWNNKVFLATKELWKAETVSSGVWTTETVPGHYNKHTSIAQRKILGRPLKRYTQGEWAVRYFP